MDKHREAIDKKLDLILAKYEGIQKPRQQLEAEVLLFLQDNCIPYAEIISDPDDPEEGFLHYGLKLREDK